MVKELDSTAKTTETSIHIVDALRELDGATLDELAAHLDLSPSTVHRHLATLQKHKYVRRTETGYEVGLQFLTVGGYAQRRTKAFPKVVEKVDSLAERTGERAQLIVEDHGERVYLYTEVGDSAVETGAHLGRRGPIHVSAAGKAILANLPRTEVEQIVDDHGLPTGGKNSITSREELFEQLERIRDRGYAFNRQESTNGVNAVGAPVLDSNESVLGALSVSGPANRVKGELLTETLVEEVLEAANELELHIEHHI